MTHIDTTSQLYFAYGSNLDPTQMERRCPGAVARGVAVLNGWGFRIGERGVATIVARPDESTWGGLWAVTDAHLDALDRAEGVAIGLYRRAIVDLTTEEGPVEAIAYIEDFTSSGAARPGYLELICRGAEWFGLPATYRASLSEASD